MSNPQTMRILIVDDHPSVREGLEQLLAAQTDMIVVGSACDGVEAVALITQLRPDVTLMDMRLPGLNGLEVIQTIRQRTAQGIFILMTSFQGDKSLAQALQAGASAFLLKETFGEEMLATIRQAYAGKTQASNGRIPNQS